MTRHPRAVRLATLLCALLLAGAARAVEVKDLTGFEALFGRYAPGGDCQKLPRILVELRDFSFEVPGNTVTVTNPEYAASYGPADYDGISQWFFPFRMADGYPILMTFNAGEVKGQLLVEPQDEGFKGGPPLSPLNKALVDGSPYARCR